MRKLLIFLILYSSYTALFAQQNLIEGEYFFNTDPGFGQGTTFSVTPDDTVNVNLNIPVDGLSPGFHTLYLRFKDDQGVWGMYLQKDIYIRPPAPPPPATQLVTGEYFFNSDPGFGQGTPITVPTPVDSLDIEDLDIPLHTLSPGFHKLYLRFKDEQGIWGMYLQKDIYIRPPTLPPPATQLVSGEYFFNSDPGFGQGTSITVPTPVDTLTIEDLDIPLHTLSPGFHKLYLRFKDEQGVWGMYLQKDIYIRPPTPPPPATQLVSGEYFFNSDPGFGQGESITIPTPVDTVEMEDLDIPLNTLSPGFHKLYLRFKDEQGRWGMYLQKDIYIRPPSLPPPATYLVSGEYFFDSDPGFGQGESITVPTPVDTVEMEDLDIALDTLSMGVHKLCLRFKDEKGIWGMYFAKDIDIGPPPPLAVVNPNYINPVSVVPGDSVDVSINIANAGGSHLEWTAEASFTQVTLFARANYSTIEPAKYRLVFQSSTGQVGVAQDWDFSDYPENERGVQCNVGTGPPWISILVDSGIVATGESFDVPIRVYGDFTGADSAYIVFYTNDPDSAIINVPLYRDTGGLVISSVVCPPVAPQGCPMTAEIKIDMNDKSTPDTLLGSFTATLTYDPTYLDYTGNSGILSGFTGAINVDEANGIIAFDGVNPYGANSLVDVFHVDFDVIGTVGYSCCLDLEFSAMAAALTYNDLLPFLQVNDGCFLITQPGLLGDVNSDDLVNSTDALVIISYDVGLPVPQPVQDRINVGFGDVNADGNTNSTDALVILSYDVGITVPYPVGQPFCPQSLASALSLAPSTTGLGGEEQIQASAIPSVDQIVVGKSIGIPITIDVSKFPEKLGSYTATLDWDPEILQYKEYYGGTTLGFESPVINELHAKKGKLVFACAYPYGSKGKVNILNLTMKVAGEDGISTDLTLSFSAMASAYTFRDLLPYVEVKESVLELSNREVPTKYGIENHPNPFNPSTEIRYQLPQAEQVRIVIYNVLGQEVRELVDGKQEAGHYVIIWNGDNEQGLKMPSGMYFLRMKAGKFTADRKLLLLK